MSIAADFNRAAQRSSVIDRSAKLAKIKKIHHHPMAGVIIALFGLFILVPGAWYLGRNQDQIIDDTIVAGKARTDSIVQDATHRVAAAAQSVTAAQTRAE